jgi:Mrp family chromosome partitioning ATPase
MTSLKDQLRGLVRAVFEDGALGGKCVLLMAAGRGEGVSTLVRALGEASAARAQRAVAIVDIDLMRDSQYAAYVAAAQAGGPGLGQGVSGVFANRIFFAPAQYSPAFTYHRVGASKLLVGHFDVSRLPRGAQLQIIDEPGYWNAARRAADLTIVDAPALDRSRIGLVVARHMDSVVIVADADAGSASATMDLKAELDSRGANTIGVIYANADPTTLAIERALSDG